MATYAAGLTHLCGFDSVESRAVGVIFVETIPGCSRMSSTSELAYSQTESLEIFDALIDKMNPLLREAVL
jgi:hypothetical protein